MKLRHNMNNEDETTSTTVFKECWRQDIWLKILTFTSIGLVISSFIVPPTGIIDPSVLAATGELAGFGAIWEFNKAMDKNIDAKVKIKELELEVAKDELSKDESSKDELSN